MDDQARGCGERDGASSWSRKDARPCSSSSALQQMANLVASRKALRTDYLLTAQVEELTALACGSSVRRSLHF